ncbi:DUF3168 domain-containing protein [Algicella marina]|uniref:DUF3168 domain-containing protein n=1 Tax=Algicella marina TaxID=2683284 RepID=A0A6P1SZB2_9RHOB|nr:DUF3168 domain-containing protein [Algicella marina]QHQ34556.1 DUF3168 domain-containing protein [Algicella marina]
MSYRYSAALQTAVYAALTGDAGVIAVLGDAIYDAPLPGPATEIPETYALIGEERVRDGSTKTNDGAVHELTVSVFTAAEGFRTAKEAAGAICAALDDGDLTLDVGHLVALRFLSARADRKSARTPRRIVLRFQAVIEAAD